MEEDARGAFWARPQLWCASRAYAETHSGLQCVRLEKTASAFNRAFTTSMVKKEFVRIHKFVRKTGKDSRVCFPGTDKLCIFLFKIAKYRLHQMPLKEELLRNIDLTILVEKFIITSKLSWIIICIEFQTNTVRL